jgi:uncharacterized membrane protein
MIVIVLIGLVVLVVSAVVIGCSMDTAGRRDRWRRVAEERRLQGERRRAEHARRWSQV